MSHSSSSPSSAYYSATSASSFVYSPEMLLQFQSNNSSTTSILSKLQLHPEITDDGTIQFRNHGITTDSDSDFSSSNMDEEDDESHYIYGDMPTRKDLNWKQLFDLRKVVRAIVQDTLTFSPPSEEHYGPEQQDDEEEEEFSRSFTTTTNAFESFRSRRAAFARSDSSRRVPNECHPESNRNTQYNPRRADQYQSRHHHHRQNNNNSNESWWPRKAPTSAPWRNLERPILVPVA